MASRHGVRDWVSSRRPRSLFQSSDVPGSLGSVNTALSRMATDPSGPITRVRNGLYWVKPTSSRFGFGRPDPVAAALSIAGPGAGPSGWSASQMLGLTTQVPAVVTIATLGRPPKGFKDIHFVTRANLDRRDLNPVEVATLEVLRDFPLHTDVGTSLDDVRRHFIDFVNSGDADPDCLIRVARKEHHAGARANLDEIFATASM